MPFSKRDNNFDWDKLRIFHAVAGAGSFTHAGHDLNCRNQPSAGRFQRWSQSCMLHFFTVMHAD